MHTGLANLGLSASPNGLSPVLDLQFLSDAGVDGRITYSGGGGGTRTNSAGLIEVKSCPRIDFDPVTHAPKGVLVEEQRTNLLKSSANGAAVDWTTGSATVTAAAGTAPDGTATLNAMFETATTAPHSILQQVGITSGATLTFSIYLKQLGRSYAVVRINDGASNANAASVAFDLTTGAITTAATAYGTFTSASATTPQPVGNGVYRSNITVTTTGVTTVYVKAFSSTDGLLAADGQANAFLGDPARGLYFWGAQLEVGSFATSYIPTAAAAVTRTADSLTMTGSNFSSWFNTLQGAFVAEFDTVALSMPSVRGVVTSGVSARYAYIPGTASMIASYDGTLVINSVASVVDGLPHKVASSYASTRTLTLDGAAVVNGAQAAAYTQGSTLLIGDINGSAALNGHIKRIRYWTSQLANTQLQALTT